MKHDNTALAICLGSAVLAAGYVRSGGSGFWAATDLGIVWFYVGNWLSGRNRLVELTFAEMQENIRQTKPTKLAPLIYTGAGVIFAVSLISWLIK